jgi:hypothetical protein
VNKRSRALIFRLKQSTPELKADAIARGERALRTNRCTVYMVIDVDGSVVGGRDNDTLWN